MKKAFRTGFYLNSWGKAFIAIQLGKTPKGIMKIYRSGILNGKISKENSIAWSKLWNDFKNK